MLKQTLNKEISTPIAISIILILVILVGGFTWWQYEEIEKLRNESPDIELPEKKEEEIKISEKLVENETADWKTYKNEEYRFEMEYPPNWEIKDNSFSNTSCDFGHWSGVDCSIDFSTSENNNLISLDEWIEDNLYHLYFPRNKETFIVDEVEGIKADITILHSLNGVVVVFTKDGLVYQFMASLKTSSTLYQMLSTFRFLE